MKILIDGDGCPVKKEIVSLAKKYQVPVTLVTSFDHYSQKNQTTDFSTVYVDRGADSADYKIVALAEKGDVCVTQDYGLASLLLAKGVTVFHQRFQYQKETIDFLLQTRFVGQMLKKSGKHQKGPTPFTNADHQAFTILFENYLKTI
ncbi:YaiI/YqxD family protein [Enterococcus timonensis]|uniref:YaiI/YqxD family protein n=1 Tax=Enterococcus timonensis TaxID=1852364 RepID=UPI0008DAF4A2|nr:YaiI/YqxD family protein [Enterococcus timonensis]